MGGEQGREERLNMSPLNPIGDQIIPALLAEFLTYTQSTTPTGRAKDLAETTLSPYTNILSGKGGLEDYAIAALPAAQYAKPIYKLGKTFAKGLGEKGAFDPSWIDDVLHKIRQMKPKERTLEGPSRPVPDTNAILERSLGFEERDIASSLHGFKAKNYQLDQDIRSARTDLAEVLGKGRTSKSTAPNARAMQAADRLALNPRLANAALEEANLNPKQLNELERMLEILRNRGVK